MLKKSAVLLCVALALVSGAGPKIFSRLDHFFPLRQRPLLVASRAPFSPPRERRTLSPFVSQRHSRRFVSKFISLSCFFFPSSGEVPKCTGEMLNIQSAVTNRATFFFFGRNGFFCWRHWSVVVVVFGGGGLLFK